MKNTIEEKIQHIYDNVSDLIIEIERERDNPDTTEFPKKKEETLRVLNDCWDEIRKSPHLKIEELEDPFLE